MARSRRALLRKGNVTNIADARKKREEKEQARVQALANARVGTLDEASRQADAIQAAIAAEAADSEALCASASGSATSQASGQVAGASAANTDMSAGSGNANGTSSHATQRQQVAVSAQNQSAKLQSIASDSPDKAAQPAARRENDPPDADAAGKKARAEKKNANRTFNREKVEAIKKAIANGTYQINATRTADKFIERESFS